MKRRVFMTAAARTAAVKRGSAAPKLSIDGGAPVREKTLRPGYWGSEFYDDKERAELLEARAPFRWYGPGGKPKKVLQFEKEFAAHMQTKYGLGVTSGTAVLQCAVAALELGPADEVILPAWTWHSCFNAVVLAGALPVCAEIDEIFT
ncbi:MAG: DegT/DnrJ/EryC1/StrS family aminotransferase [Acidobacteriota bacterium]